MAVKILIKRTVPKEKARKLIPLFRQIRSLAINQPGYITGENLETARCAGRVSDHQHLATFRRIGPDGSVARNERNSNKKSTVFWGARPSTKSITTDFQNKPRCNRGYTSDR